MSDRETVTINDTEIPVLAYMHRTSDTCVTAAYNGEGATTYENPRKLVVWEDVVDQADWLENGINEWRGEAVLAHQKAANLAKQRDELLKALERLSFAAMCRDNTMGDQCRLIEVKAELAAANRQAQVAIASMKETK